MRAETVQRAGRRQSRREMLSFMKGKRDVVGKASLVMVVVFCTLFISFSWLDKLCRFFHYVQMFFSLFSSLFSYLEVDIWTMMRHSQTSIFLLDERLTLLSTAKWNFRVTFPLANEMKIMTRSMVWLQPTLTWIMISFTGVIHSRSFPRWRNTFVESRLM